MLSATCNLTAPPRLKDAAHVGRRSYLAQPGKGLGCLDLTPVRLGLPQPVHCTFAGRQVQADAWSGQHP